MARLGRLTADNQRLADSGSIRDPATSVPDASRRAPRWGGVPLLLSMRAPGLLRRHEDKEEHMT
jgi:hypothetical protein